MELLLAHQDETQIAVICDGRFSHTFDLQPLILSKEAEEEHLLSDPVGYGQRLYAALFATGTLAYRLLESSPERIVLVASDNDLDALPWEYLAGPHGFLVREHCFVRGLPFEQRVPVPTPDTNLHIVAVPSHPLSSQVLPLNIDAEWMVLQESLASLPFALSLERTRPPALEQLCTVVEGQQHRVVHFMGHGGQEQEGAVLYFEKEDGELDPVEGRELALRVRGTTLLVVLNACTSATPGPTSFSNLAATLVRQKIPYALGMRLSIYDKDARLFARAFYDDLVRGTSIEEALRQARLTLARESQHPWVVGIPVLYTSLVAPAPGFLRSEGTPVVHEHQPRMEVSALPRVEGTFQGRIQDLKRLGGLLTGDTRPRILTIHGGGGQGKTTLAREAVERFAFAWPGGVWATSLENLPDRMRLAADLARFLGIKPQEIGDPEEVERQVLARLRGQRTLIVLDNAETLVDAVEVGDLVALDLSRFLQQLPSTSVSLLVTSRVPLGWVDEIVYAGLGGLPPQEGARLFEQCAPQKGNEIERNWVKVWKISEKVEGHPLSLRLLGSTFNTSMITLDAFIQEYEAQLMQGYNKYRNIDDRHRSLFACIDTSVYYLDTELRTLLCELCIFHSPFLAETAVDIFDPEVKETQEAPSYVRFQLYQLWQRNLLVQRHITTRDETLHFYYLLPTVRSYIEQHLPLIYPQEELFSRFGSAHAKIASFSFRKLHHTSFAEVLTYQTRADIERGIVYVAGVKQAIYKIHWAWLLHSLGSSRQSLQLLEEVLGEVQEREQAVTLFALSSMGSIYYDIGQSQRALDRLEQALPLYREVGDHSGEANTINNMGEIYRAMRQPERAFGLFEEALSIYHEVGDRLGEATTLNKIAQGYRATGQLEQALSFFEQTLPIYREVGDRVGEATALNNIGEACGSREHPKRVLSFYEQALPIWREVGNRNGEAATLNNMGEIYCAIGESQRGLSLLEQALSILREVGNRTLEATVLSNMGEAYRTIGYPKRALSLLEQSLAITREVGDHAGEATTLNNMGLAYAAIGKTQEALSLLEQSLAIAREVGNYAEEASTLNNIGDLYHDREELQQALTFYEQALSIWRRLGNRAAEAENLNKIAKTYRVMGNIERALSLYEQALPLYRGMGKRVEEATALNGMAVAYQSIEQPEQALSLYEQALFIKREVGDHAGEANTLTNIAGLFYRFLNRPHDAVTMMEEAINVLARADLSQTAGGQTEEELRHLLQMMRREESLFSQNNSVSTFSAEELERYVQTTIEVMTIVPEHQDNLRSALEKYLESAQSWGPSSKVDVDFFTALLVLIDKRMLILSHDHPYNSIMRAGIATEMTTLNNTAQTYRATGQPERALSFYEQALPIYRETDDRLGEANAFNNMSEIYHAMKLPERALNCYEQALPIYREIGDHSGEANTLTNIAGLFYQSLNRSHDAITTMAEAINVLARAGLSQTAGGQTEEELRCLMQIMSRGEPLLSQNNMMSTLPSETIDEHQLEATDPDPVRSLNNLAMLYYQQERYGEAEQLLKHALTIWEQQLESDHPDAAICLSNLAMLYDKQRKYTEAEPLLKRALAVREHQLGVDHPDLVDFLNNLATFYDKEGKYSEAELLLKRALEIREKQLGADHLDTADSLNTLGGLYDREGKYSEAELLLKRALEIREKQLGADHLDTADSLNTLGGLYDREGKYSEAELLLKRALEIREKQLGVDHLDTAGSLNNLAMLYDKQGKYSEVEALLKRSLESFEQELGATHPNLTLILNNLAEFYREQGKYREAEPLYQRALTIGEQGLGATHPNIALVLNNLAELYKTQEKYEEAELLLKRALELCEQQLGAIHPATALSLSNLGGLYYRQQKYEEAILLWKQALEIYELQLGAIHPEVARCLNGLGGVYREQEKYEEAEPLLKRALEIYEQHTGTMHSNVALSLNNLAALYYKQGKYGQAEPLYQRAVAIWEQQLGRTHPNVALGLSNLAALYYKQGKYGQAVPLSKRALAIYESVLGWQHPITQAISTQYASLVQKWSMSQLP